MEVELGEEEIVELFRALVRSGVATYDIWSAVIFEMSRRGATRQDAIVLLGRIATELDETVAESEVDLLDTVALHLMGQCNIRDVIRLFGDPEDQDELMDELSRSGVQRGLGPVRITSARQ